MVTSALPHLTRRGVLRTFVAGICLLSVSVFAQGCRKAEQARPAEVRQHRTVVIGLVPEEGIFSEASRYRVLVRYLSLKTGYDVRATVFPRYDQVVTGFAAKRLDAAFFGSFTYVLAHEQAGAQIIARPEWKDGTSTYQGLLIVRKDSGIRTIDAMKGKRFVFVDRETTAGYLLPLAYFRKHGVDYRSWFRETYFAGTHADAMRDVLDREADAGAVKSTMFDQLAREDSRVKAELLVLDRSPEVPENGLAVRKDLDPEVKERLAAVLLSMEDDPAGARALDAFGARRFIRTVDDDYRPVRDYARTAGVSLRTGRERSGK